MNDYQGLYIRKYTNTVIASGAKQSNVIVKRLLQSSLLRNDDSK
jgi:hypothetical protein